jgi:diadenosine tetraphosphate (Ap4A) HIT family hydrolase
VNHYVFCALVAGEREASVVYEDDCLLGFMDLHPVNPGHVLLVPKASESDT